MKTISSLMLIGSMFVLPCILNLEKLICCVVTVAAIAVSFALFRKYNPEYINH